MVKVADALQAAVTDSEAAMSDLEASPDKDQLMVPINLVKSRLVFAAEVLNLHVSAAASLTELINNVKENKN